MRDATNAEVSKRAVAPVAFPSAPLSALGDKLCDQVASFSEAALARYMPWSREGELPGFGVLFNTAERWRSGASLTLQPRRCGPVVQPQGLEPMAHVALATSAAHPLGAPPLVPHGFAYAAAAEKALGKAVVTLRLRRIALLEKWVAEGNASQSALANAALGVLHKFASRPTLVLGRILGCIGSPDVSVAAATASGLRDWGLVPETGIFPPADVISPPLTSVEELLAGASVRNKELAQRLERHHPHAQVLWDQGELAFSMGAVGPDIPVHSLPLDSVACLKFGVRQRGSDGRDEIRACADESSGPGGNAYNGLWSASEKVVMSDADTIMAELALVARLHGLPVRSRKRP